MPALEGPFITSLTSGLILLLLVLEKVLALLDPIYETLGEIEDILFTSNGEGARGIVEFIETEFVITGDIDEFVGILILPILPIPECSKEFCKFFISVIEQNDFTYTTINIINLILKTKQMCSADEESGRYV